MSNTFPDFYRGDFSPGLAVVFPLGWTGIVQRCGDCAKKVWANAAVLWGSFGKSAQSNNLWIKRSLPVDVLYLSLSYGWCLYFSSVLYLDCSNVLILLYPSVCGQYGARPFPAHSCTNAPSRVPDITYA